MSYDGRGHRIKNPAPQAQPAAPGRLQAVLEAAAAEFGFTVEELVEYTARGVEETTARARSKDGEKDAEYTRKLFPSHVRFTLYGTREGEDP